MNILEARRRTLGKGVYKKTVEGNPAIAQGSLARRYPGITMQGWTEQAQYEGNQLFDVNEVEYNKVINVGNGNISDNGSYSVSPYIPVKPNTTYSRTYNSILGNVIYDSDKQFVSNVAGGGTIAVPENGAFLRFNLPVGVDFAEAMMVNKGSTLLPWEPYTGGAPSPSPDYPQEIVSAGKYNEDTQKWEYEITIANAQTDPDKNQTVTLTADRPLTKWDRLEKRNGQWGWVYKSAEIVLDGSEQNVEGFVLRNETVAVYYVEILEKQKGSDNVIIDKMRYEYGAWGGTTGEYTFSGHPVSKLIYLSIPVSEEGEGIKSWFTSNPLVLWCETAEETFVPLSASEQEQMNALHTFRPTTVLSNDCGCEMTLTYKTKKYLEVTT